MKAERRGGWVARLPYAEAMEIVDWLWSLEQNTRATGHLSVTTAEIRCASEGAISHLARKYYPLTYMGRLRGHLARLRRLRWVRLSATGKSVTLTPRGARAVETLLRLRAAAEAIGHAAHTAAAQAAWAALTQKEPTP